MDPPKKDVQSKPQSQLPLSRLAYTGWTVSFLLFNVPPTLFEKIFMSRIEYKFPFALTVIQCFVSVLGCLLGWALGFAKWTDFKNAISWQMLMVALLNTLSMLEKKITLSFVSLAVSFFFVLDVPYFTYFLMTDSSFFVFSNKLFETVRALIPCLIVIFTFILYGRTHSLKVMIPIFIVSLPVFLESHV